VPARDTDRRYAFGDSEAAAERLELLARLFGPTSASFVLDAAPRACALAVDLGCGPGHTTALLARTLAPARTVGLERSRAFVARAANEVGHQFAAGAVAFAKHDVTRLPLPTGPADLLFARYLLAHLADPEARVAAWATQLRPRGRLLLEEVERIDTQVPALASYLEAAAALLRRGGTELYVGERLDRSPTPSGVRRVLSRNVTVAPPTAAVARMFALNLSVWRNHADLATERGAGTLDMLAGELRSLCDSPGSGEIVWTHRQIAYQR
jgi:SAM-dependent methyltransferase